MFFGFCNAFRESGFNYCKNLLLMGQDIDERCIWMAYIQCSLYGLPAIIQQMDTLQMKEYGEPWYTPVYIFDGWNVR